LLFAKSLTALARQRAPTAGGVWFDRQGQEPRPRREGDARLGQQAPRL